MNAGHVRIGAWRPGDSGGPPASILRHAEGIMGGGNGVALPVNGPPQNVIRHAEMMVARNAAASQHTVTNQSHIPHITYPQVQQRIPQPIYQPTYQVQTYLSATTYQPTITHQYQYQTPTYLPIQQYNHYHTPLVYYPPPPPPPPPRPMYQVYTQPWPQVQPAYNYIHPPHHQPLPQPQHHNTSWSAETHNGNMIERLWGVEPTTSSSNTQNTEQANEAPPPDPAATQPLLDPAQASQPNDTTIPHTSSSASSNQTPPASLTAMTALAQAIAESILSETARQSRSTTATREEEEENLGLVREFIGVEEALRRLDRFISSVGEIEIEEGVDRFEELLREVRRAMRDGEGR